MARFPISTVVLLSLAIAAIDSILLLAKRNGFFDLYYPAMEPQPNGVLLLPELQPREPMVTRFTGIPPLDQWLVGLLMFFHPIVAAQRPTLALFAVYMAGQCYATHTLVVLEGMRNGNRGRAISL